MKNSYEVLSPLFMKLAGLFVSIYLCILSVKLFMLSPSQAYWQTNAFSVWPIILGAAILCVCFSMFIFSKKIDNGKICLFGMYVLCFIKCILFLLIFNMRLRTLSDANMMLNIVLCFGFLFIFLEFLHAQTSGNYIEEKTLVAGVIGIVSCIFALILVIYISLSGLFLPEFYLIFYLPYALHIFVFSKIRKKVLIYNYGLFTLMLIILSLFIVQWSGRSFYVDIAKNIVLIEIFTIFCCTQLIPPKSKQKSNDIETNPLRKLTSSIMSIFHCANNNICYSNELQPEAFPMIKGIFKLTVRFTYFTLLAKFLTTIIWRGF